ncbi:MAG: glycosyltransferase family 4 protein [bacterium]
MALSSRENASSRDSAPGLLPLALGIATNEPRSRYLIEALKARGVVQATWDFDRVDRVTRALVAALTFHPVRAEWWGRFQMHPLMQRRRRQLLLRAMGEESVPVNALLCWGSWFHPFQGEASPPPFFNYIDQSRSLQPLPGESPASSAGRVRSHALQAETYRDSSGIFCMSEWARAQTIEAHPAVADKVRVVGWGPCAVDLSAETPPEVRENIVLHVSNDFRRKGVDYLVSTAERVAARVPDVQFLVVGQDKRADWVHDTAHVRFLGVQRGEALASLFRRAKVFFLPHRFDRSPHVLVEAMSAALPLVTSAQGGPMELIEGKGTGSYAPVGDIDGYSEALVSFLTDEDKRRHAGDAGRKLMREKYTWSSVTDRILDLIDEARRAPSDLSRRRS